MSTRISQDSLRPPTDYKRRFEREQHVRQQLERRVEALTLERDALKYRLQQAQRESAQYARDRGLAEAQRQATLGMGA